jgi:hypothetical protein
MPRRTLYKKRTWEKVKSLINDKKGYQIDFDEKQNGVFRVFVEKGRTQFFVNLYPPGFGHVVGISDTNDADFQEFADTYQTPIEDNPPAEVEHVLDTITGVAVAKTTERHTGDGKLRVLSSHKPLLSDGRASYNYFAGEGDLIASGTVGGGQSIQLCSVSGTNSEQMDIKFMNCVYPPEEIWIFGGCVMWEGAHFGDTFSMEVRTMPSPVVPKVVADTIPLPCDFNLDGDRIVATIPGSGTHALGGLPVFVPNWDKEGYWDLDAAGTSAVPNMGGAGEFDWHTVDASVGDYMRRIPIMGDNYVPNPIDATEAAPLPYGHYIRIILHCADVTDEPCLSGYLRIYRERLK